MRMILNKLCNIFCYAALAKGALALLKNKLNLVKVFNNLGSIIKFATAIGAMSANFLLLRWTAGHVRKIKLIR